MAHLIANYLPLVEGYQNASIHEESDRPDGNEIAGLPGGRLHLSFFTGHSTTTLPKPGHAEVVKALQFAASSRDRVEDNPGNQAEDREHHDARRQDRRRKTRHQSSFHELEYDGEAERQRDQCQQGEGDGVEKERALVLGQYHNRPENAETVPVCIQLADTLFGPVPVRRVEFGDRNIQRECVDR